MTAIPIFDDAYIENMHRRQHMEAMFRTMSERSAAHRRAVQGPDTEASLTKLYLAGELTVEQFENRLDRMHGLT